MPSVNPRKLVTSAIADYLKTPDTTDPDAPVWKTSAAGRVFDNDATPPDADELNEINVVFMKETIDETTMHQDGRRRRIMQAQVECYNTRSKGDADDLAWEVEEAIRENPTIGNTVEWMKLTDLSLFVVENSTLALFSVVMTYEITYWTHVAPEEGITPTMIVLGVEPETGPGNEGEYIELAEAFT